LAIIVSKVLVGVLVRYRPLPPTRASRRGQADRVTESGLPLVVTVRLILTDTCPLSPGSPLASTQPFCLP